MEPKTITPTERTRLREVCDRANSAWDAHLKAANERRDLIRTLRDRGFSLRELADMTGVSYQRISRIAAGHNGLYRKNLTARIASLETEVRELRGTDQ